MFKKQFLLAGIIVFFITSSARAEPKNVIFLIGDGMGFEQVRSAGMYADGEAGNLLFETFPYKAEVTTYSANASVTDSAAAATAIATGIKVNNGVISMAIPGDEGDLYSLLEYFSDMGKSTGLVTTTYMTHATPAAFGAHEPSRNNLEEIAGDYLGQTLPDILFGGGDNGMSVNAAQNAGYTVVINRVGLQSLNTSFETMVSGQFGSSHLPYEYDGSFGALPHLSEMTATALDILDNNPLGFFLMVEGGKIDHAGHSNNIARNIFETLEFENTVQAVYDWAEGATDTLVIVTADHETGGLTILQNNGQGIFPTVSWSTDGHTGDNVPAYAWGENAHLVSGTLDNTDFFQIATTSFYCDSDEDGFFSSLARTCAEFPCENQGCQTHPGVDCNDSDPDINPDACDIREDGIDQDCNGKDRLKGKPCSTDGGGDSVEVPGQTCLDGEDNDGDGKTDCNDRDCRKAPECSDSGGGSKVENCIDGVDNDGDGKIDCADKKDCRTASNCSQ